MPLAQVLLLQPSQTDVYLIPALLELPAQKQALDSNVAHVQLATLEMEHTALI